MDPARNNMPLEFNRNKGKPPMTYIHSEGEGNDGEDVSSSTATSLALAVASSTAAAMMTNTQFNMANSGMEMGDGENMGGGMMGHMTHMGPMAHMGPNPMMMGPMNMGQFGGIMGPIGPMGPMGLLGPGPGSMGMGMGPLGPGMGPMGPPMQQKEVITLNSCMLYPPHPDAPPHSARERPPGCRTAFVGGLPENITEEILHEVFERCGPIETIRLGKKNFAHIRFMNHDSVEQAMYLSGYRMKIENKDDKPNTGRLHVDYANARNDQHEWECEQRALAREMRHQQQIHEERLRVPSPPPVSPFTIFDGNALLEVVKSDTGFVKGSQKLITWLERGSVDKRSSNLFYSLVQSSNTHVRRLMSEKHQHEEEINQAKMLYKQRVQGIIAQLGQIERVFAAARKQKNWDHFTKAQRKNIDVWFKQVQEIKTSQQAEFLRERNEDEMELSDTEGEGSEPATKKKRIEDTGIIVVSVQMDALKEENDSLKCQLAAYVNEAEMVKMEAKQNTEALERQVTSLQNALKGMQQQLISHQAQARRPIEKEGQNWKSSSDEKKDKNNENEDTEENTEGATAATTPLRSQDSAISSSGIYLTEKEARILGLVSCFLNVHPHGATMDYLWSYLSQLMTVRPREVEDLFDRMPDLFRQEVAGCGATLERRWVFIGFQKESA